MTYPMKRFCLYALLLLYSCGNNHPSLKNEGDRPDTLQAFYRRGIAVDPASTRQKIRDRQQGLVDSLEFYRLQSLVGISYYYENKLDSACWAGKAVVDFCQRANQGQKQLKQLELKQYNHLGVFLEAMGQRDSSIACYRKAVATAYDADQEDILPDLFINLASNYRATGNYLTAISYYRNALRLADSLKRTEEFEYTVNSGLGQVYTLLKNYPQAEYHYGLVEKMLDSIPPYDQYFFANTLGNHHYNTKEYHKALTWFYKANRIVESLAHPFYKATTEGNLGEIYLLLNQPDSARYYLEKAAKVFLAPEAGASEMYYMEGLYASLLLHENDLQSAEHLLSKPYDLSEINPMYVYFNDKRQEELYRRKGNYQKAYTYRLKADAYDDSLRNLTVQNNIAEIDSRYRQDTMVLKRDALIAQQKQTVVQFRNISLLTGILLVAILLGGIAAVLLFRKRRDLRNERQLARIAELRMENARNRISPHFVFNVLNAFIPTLRQHEELARPLWLLTQSIRENLLLSDKIAVPLDEEVNFVKNYLLLRKSVDPAVRDVQWSIAPEVDGQMLIPSMIIQIPVENALKYAFEQLEEHQMISITITLADSERISILIEDNGVGFDPGKNIGNLQGTRNGLMILSKTIELLNANNTCRLEFGIENLANQPGGGHGTRVSILIPLRYRYKLSIQRRKHSYSLQ